MADTVDKYIGSTVHTLLGPPCDEVHANASLGLVRNVAVYIFPAGSWVGETAGDSTRRSHVVLACVAQALQLFLSERRRAG